MALLRDTMVFSGRRLTTNQITLKVGLYFHAENEVANFKTWNLNYWKNTNYICQGKRRGSNVKIPYHFEWYCSTQAPAISGQYVFLSCTLPLFCCCDLDQKPMTLKLKCYLDFLKMYLRTKNEDVRSSHFNVIAWIEEDSKLDLMSGVNVECRQLLNTSNVHRETLLPRYANFRPAVFEILRGQTNAVKTMLLPA